MRNIKYGPPPQYTIGGIGVMFNSVLNELTIFDQKYSDSIPYIDWTDKRILYYDSDKGDNVWNYYFHNIEKYDEYLSFDSNEFERINECTWESKYHINMNSDEKIDEIKLKILCELYKKYIKIKGEITEFCDDFFNRELSDNTLGVQYRYTDKIVEVRQKSPQELINVLIKEIDKYDYIFVATDYQPVVEELGRISEKFKFIDAKRSSNMTGSHFIKNNRPFDNYLKGLEAIYDMIILSKCKSFLYSRSNISLSSMIINGQKYEFIKLLNEL